MEGLKNAHQLLPAAIPSPVESSKAVGDVKIVITFCCKPQSDELPHVILNVQLRKLQALSAPWFQRFDSIREKKFRTVQWIVTWNGKKSGWSVTLSLQ